MHKQKSKTIIQKPQELKSITATGKVKELFLKGEKLTVLDILRKTHTTEGRSIIARLRKRGWNIQSYQKCNENFNTYYLV